MARSVLECLIHPARNVAAGVALSIASSAFAGDKGVEVDVELVLAVDISYSMDRLEQELQRNGYVEAIKSEQFLNALKAGATGKVAISYMQWASYSDQDVLMNWAVIDGPETANAFANRLARMPYRRAQRTSISGAIDYGSKMFENNGFKGLRQVIDVSGDGPNNNGRIVTHARDDALAKGITINGLPLVGIREWFSPADIKELDIYYEDCVIGGPEAFSITVRDVKSFVDATRTKLVREIAAVPQPTIGNAMKHASGKIPPVRRAQAPEPRISCTIGESLWRGRWGN
jgi:hypothetical protein